MADTRQPPSEEAPTGMEEALEEQGAPAPAGPPQADGPSSEAAADGGVEADDEVAALPPDHPLLRRAQEALQRQLAEQKQRLEEDLRDRKKALKVRERHCWQVHGSQASRQLTCSDTQSTL